MLGYISSTETWETRFRLQGQNHWRTALPTFSLGTGMRHAAKYTYLTGLFRSLCVWW